LNTRLTSTFISLLLFQWFLFAHFASAQKTDFQSWNQLSAQIAIDQEKKWLFYFEAQPRISDNVSQLERLIIRPAIGYNYDNEIVFYLGYGWTPGFMDSHYDGDFNNENRIWQQVLLRKTALGINWVHGFRQEQRFISDTSDVSNRFRYQLRGSYKFYEEQNFGLTAYQMLFFNLNSVDNGPRAGFDRARAFFGPFWEIESARYEVGYLGEYGKRFGGDDRVVNALLLSAAFSF
jgi:hypothetical protein